MKVPRIEPAVNTANNKMIVEVMSRSFSQTDVFFIKIRSDPYELRFLNSCVDHGEGRALFKIAPFEPAVAYYSSYGVCGSLPPACDGHWRRAALETVLRSFASLGALMERADIAVLMFFIALALVAVAAVFVIPYP